MAWEVGADGVRREVPDKDRDTGEFLGMPVPLPKQGPQLGVKGYAGYVGVRGYTGVQGYVGVRGEVLSPIARQRIMRMVEELRPPPPPPMPWYCTIWTHLSRWLGWSTSESAE